MPDHLHLIATVAAETPLTHTVMYWKRYLAREAGVDWQRDFFEHRLRRDEHFDAKVDYLRMNPVRAGLVANPDEWPYFWTW
jgi:REP element-mobilizing transposase RayT